MCGGPTELQKALKKFSFVNSSANVSYTESKKYVTIQLHEKELVDLEKSLTGLSLPQTITSISVNYTTLHGKTYFQSLPHLTTKINASNRGNLKKNKPLQYFTTLAGDTDDWIGANADLADDNSGSRGSYKNYTLTLQDPEAVMGSSSSSCSSCDNSAYNSSTGRCGAPTTNCPYDSTCCITP
jgi:hypothetical protein